MFRDFNTNFATRDAQIINSFNYSCGEDFSSVWSDSLVNSVKIDDDGEVTDFENEIENDFETLFYFNVFRAFG